MYKLLVAFGVLMWVVSAAWLVRFGMGLEHFSEDQILHGIVGGICGGLGACYYVPRLMKSEAEKLAAERKW